MPDIKLQDGEYVLTQSHVARLGQPLLPLPDRCCGCIGTHCCIHGEAPCST